MERSLTFRFYKIGRKSSKVPLFVDALREIDKIQKKGDREREIGSDFVVRLEEFGSDGPGAYAGEIVRVQSRNMPSEVSSTGRAPLSTANPLGHGVAFRYNEAKSIICIQHEPRIASCGRFLDYIFACWPEAFYDVKPVIRPKAWEMFNKGDVKKIAIKLAEPENLGALASAHEAASTGFRKMAEAYDAPIIKIELSMGHRGGKLSDKVKALAEGLLKQSSSGASVEGMKALAYVDDAREDIDLIESRLKVTETLPLDDRDPAKNYSIKKMFLKKAMNEQGF